MKTRFVKAILTLALALLSIPMQSQDYMNIFFKDGSFRKFYMKNVTEILVSKTDAEGVVHSDYSYQHITTLYNQYVYLIEDIDSISFSKFNEEQAIQNASFATDAVEKAIQNCATIDDVKPKLDEIKKTKGIDDAWISDNQLFVKVQGWEKIVYYFSGEDTVKDEEDDMLTKTRSILSETRSSSSNQKLRAVIANQQYKDEAKIESFMEKYKTLVSDFEKCGIEAKILDGPDIQFFRSNSDNVEKRRNMYDYDIVFVRSHGGSQENYVDGELDKEATTHSIVSSEELGIQGETEMRDVFSSLRSLRFEDCTDDHIYLSGNHETRNGVKVVVYHPGLSELFFEEKADGKFLNPNSILFLGACLTLKDNYNFAKLFVGKEKKNLGSYWGYDKSTYRAGYAGIDFFNGILNGKSQYISYSELDSKYKTETDKEGANLLRWPLIEDNKQMYIIPTITKETDPEEVLNNYNASNLVEVTGYATTLNPDGISMGFMYGTDEQLVSCGIVPAVDVVSLLKPVEDGNVLFRANITDIKPKTTYYYRAYTFDGKYYNYGETYSFKIEKQEEPDEPSTEKELMLSEFVDGVDYKIYKKILNASDYHENPDGWKCYRSELSLETTANGSTNTIVLDNKIYLDDSKGHHGGQYPCILIDHKKDLFIVFCNSKDEANQYYMDCYSYVSSIKTLDFHREKVLDRVNMGWYPYFVENAEGLPAVAHFSYAGYYAMQSIRNDDGAWNTLKGSKINPGDFETKSKKAGQILVIYDDGGEDNPPGGDDNPSTSCPAKITSVELINAGYFRNEEHPNRLYFNVNATLDNLTGIEEWGVYVDYDTKVEMPFKKVESQQTKTMAYSFKQDMRNDELIVFDLDSYVVEWDDEVGVYVKRRDSSSGELITIYGDKYQFKLRYDTKPSMVLSDPVIVGTEVTGTENGYKKYKTTITYKYDLKGAFWIDYVDSAVSGGEWSFDGFDETWYPEYDHAGESEWVATYSDDTSELNHTNWRRLHLRNYATVNSNYVNFTGNGTLTEAWVTSNPVYSRARSNADTTQKCLIREVMIPAAAPEVKAVTSYKGGSLAEVAE